MGVEVQGLGLRFPCRGVDNDEQVLGVPRKPKYPLVRESTLSDTRRD